MNKFSQKTLILALVIFALVIAGGALAYLKLKPQPEQNQNTNQPVDQNTNAEPVDVPNPYWTIDYENWQTFKNEEYNYQIDIPPGWEVKPPQQENRYVYINKKGEKAQFPLVITIQDNPNKYSSKEFVHWGKGYYDKEYEVIIGDSYKAYEFYNVWAGDQHEEIIYLAKDDIVIQFSFPIARENPNLDNPIENNQLVHQALKTFKFIAE